MQTVNMKKTEYRFPAEYEPHEGTLLIWPERPGSWGIDTTESENAYLYLVISILRSEDVYLLVSTEAKKQEVLRKAFLSVKREPDTGKENTALGQDFLSAFGHTLRLICRETDDSWARDTGPTFLLSNDGRKRLAVNWRFNAWGGEVDGLYASWDKDDAVAKAFAEFLGDEVRDADPFVLEGGSIHSDGEGTLMVTEACLLSAGRNPELTKQEIEDRLKSTLGIEKVLWLPRGIYDDETNEHVDNVAAFVGPAEVVLAWTDNEKDPQYALSRADYLYLSSETDARGRKLKIHKLPIPDVPVCYTAEEAQEYAFEPGEDTREAGERLAASYVNFYFTNDAVLLPQFGGENAESDRRAVKLLEELCPGRRVIPVPARRFILGGGNIHCLTQQIPAVRMPAGE